MKSRSEKGRYTLTMHNSKKFGSPKHNDRNFDLSKNSSIDLERVRENLYFNPYEGFYRSGDSKLTFEEIEKEFYEKHLKAKVDKTNENYIRHRNKEKCISLKSYYSKHPPEESIFEIGDMTNHPDSTAMGQISHDFILWHEERFPKIVILNAAVHLDENTPHMHLRKVFMHRDKYGLEEVQMKGCLKDMGIERPDLTKKESRNNNRQQTYTKMCRDKLIELCKEHNLEIIEEPNLNRPKDISKNDYILAKQRDELDDLRANVKLLEKDNIDKQNALDKAKMELDKATKELELKENKSATIDNIFSRKKKYTKGEIADLVKSEEYYRNNYNSVLAEKENLLAKNTDLENRLKKSYRNNKELINDNEFKEKVLADKGIDKKLLEDYKRYINAPGMKKRISFNEYEKNNTSKVIKEKERDIYSR